MYACADTWSVIKLYVCILGALMLPVVVLDSAQTTQRRAEHFIHQEQRWDCSRIIRLPTYAMAERMQRSARQSCNIIDATLDPLCSCPTTSSMGDTPYMWHASSVKWHVTFWDLSRYHLMESDKCHTILCLACAHVYVGYNTMQMNIPKTVIVVKSRKCDTIPKNTPFRLTPRNDYLCTVL